MFVGWWPKHHLVDVTDVVLENSPRRPSIVEAEELSQLESHVITDMTRQGYLEYAVQQASSVGGRQCLQNTMYPTIFDCLTADDEIHKHRHYFDINVTDFCVIFVLL